MLHVVTDSTADLSPSTVQEYGIAITPLNVIFEGNTYADGVDLTKEQFYAKMATSKVLPTTSQPSPALMKERFQKIIDQGHDVYYIGIASTLSGTIQSARIGRDMVTHPERVTIFDSLNVSFGQGVLALEAAKMARIGKTAAEITARLKNIRERFKLVFSVATLENLRRSGRINNLSYLFGSLLAIKPILMLDTDGIVQQYDKVRGKKNALNTLLRFVETHPPDPEITFGIGHIAAPERAEELRELMHERGITNTEIFEISGVVGTHVGLGTTGLLYVAKD
ncbi:DegV family protein [Tumebacillus lipolyticus]|uniref:DegV family protein n=1 Tax=Tumebacillus lipolyticus TaxID=1280370 RepID=A0ABW5A059_9BACL